MSDNELALYEEDLPGTTPVSFEAFIEARLREVAKAYGVPWEMAICDPPRRITARARALSRRGFYLLGMLEQRRKRHAR